MLRSRAAGAALIAVLVAAAGCNRSEGGLDGFVLPEGNVSAGERAFTRLGCNGCHAIEGREDLRAEGIADMRVSLGGGVAPPRGELATSIVNPSHRVAEGYGANGAGEDAASPMRSYVNLITVGELADLVAFLESEYE